MSSPGLAANGSLYVVMAPNQINLGFRDDFSKGQVQVLVPHGFRVCARKPLALRLGTNISELFTGFRQSLLSLSLSFNL